MTASTATRPQPADLVDLFTRLPGGVHHVHGWVRQGS